MAVHHVVLLAVQIACLNILLQPYITAFRTGPLDIRFFITKWGVTRFVSTLVAIGLFSAHIYSWATFPADIARLFVTQWLAVLSSILAVWTVYRYRKTQAIDPESGTKS